MKFETPLGRLFVVMDVTNLRFDIDGFDGGIESRRIGDHIEISYQGMVVMGFDVNELTARDWTIASLLETQLKGKAVAQLCHTSPAHVSVVKKLLRQGGHDALRHGQRGAKKKIVGAALVKAIEMRRQGATVRDIARGFGVSSSTASKAVEGIPRGPRGQVEQRALPVQQEPCIAEPVVDADESSTVPVEVDADESSMVPIEVDADESSMVPVEVDADESSMVPVAQEIWAEGVEPESSVESLEVEAERPRELVPGEPLPVGPAEHECRYAGTLLIVAAARVLGLFRGLLASDVHRPKKSVYPAWQAIVGLLSAWASGFVSLEAMHERDARALGVVLGLERSPSVRTLHRAIAQMVSVFEPIALRSALLRGLIAAFGKVPTVFGVDGHFKAYSGKEPIDKGYNTKRRLAERGVADVLVHDEHGRIWLGLEVGAGNSLHEHVGSCAHKLRAELGEDEQIVMACDRGGFSFEVLESLNREGFGYVVWVPSSVSLPELSSIAPTDDGVGEQLWQHSKLSDGHPARLLVQRDGKALLPIVTNLPDEVSAPEAVEMLRRVRGIQENDIKAARSFAHIDRLVDRGGARHARDDRQVDNPEHQELSRKHRETRDTLKDLEHRNPISKPDKAVFNGELLIAELEQALVKHQMQDVHAKVPRHELEPEAQRAWLKTKNRSLLQPLKYLMANSRRWLLSALGPALAPNDAPWDMTAIGRTLEALIRAPGTVRFEADQVVVTLELPLPPKPHARLAQGLAELQQYSLRFSDGRRPVTFRLAPRPTRDSLPSVTTAVQ